MRPVFIACLNLVYHAIITCQYCERIFWYAIDACKAFYLWQACLPIGHCITVDNPLLCDFKLIKVKETRRKFLSKINICKQHEDSVNNNSSSYVSKSIEWLENAFVEGYWNILKEALVEFWVLERLSWNSETWLQNDD